MPKLADQTIGTIAGMDWSNASSVAAMLLAIAQSGAMPLVRQTPPPYIIEQHEGTNVATRVEEHAAFAVLSALQQLHANLVQTSIELLPEDRKLLHDNLWDLYE